ncbi:hypothetical protein L249_5914 [Ophiocordyceps polyrhachis-furcata BCC 54312]|uniref:Ribosomal protein S11 n=1 Tax=Ophiocordyceps polyrhachis-furcata BCC 54312 TaxID=1330021 RepID=A0A367LIA5_9HYPO|nr:hypothetical protein L249_5914 [Ophiocordyceps polyrhachis-furcata BCC 54312]
MSRALAGRPALRQVFSASYPSRRSRFLSQTAASWRDEEPPGASPKINPLTTVFQPGAPPVESRKDTRDELYASSLHNLSPYDSDITGQSSWQSDSDYSKVAGTLYASSQTAGYDFSKPEQSQSTSGYRTGAGSAIYNSDLYPLKPDSARSSSEWSRNLNSSLYGQRQPTMAAKDVQTTNEENKRISEGLFGARQTVNSRAGRSDPAHYDAFESLRRSTPVDTKVLDNPLEQSVDEPPPSVEPHHLHVYAHKHNCHITLTRPNRDPIISLSCGNIGFLKANRGLFDSAYSLAKYVFERLMQKNIKINALELVLRGYGEGRQAMLKLLLSPDGAFLRHKITRVSDSTRLKFGGCRSPGRRRV